MRKRGPARCYVLDTPDGPLRVQAEREPDAETAAALVDLLRAGAAYLDKHPEDTSLLMRAIRERGSGGSS